MTPGDAASSLGEVDGPSVAAAATGDSVTPGIITARLALEPLTVEHADEMVGLLADRALYAFYDDETSPTLDELRERYERQVRGHSHDGTERWHNWVLRVRETGEAAGFVQATVRGSAAELAWVVGTAYQGRGYATEAATAVRDSLLRGDTGTPVREVLAHIAPGHRASESVARHLGLTATDITVAGETRWHIPPP